MAEIISKEEYRLRLRAFLARHEPVTGQLSLWYYFHRRKFHEELQKAGITISQETLPADEKSRP